ncbi:hypothetical protein RR48_14083 [Papilio machaon]|uniref:Uncharacterized protein n=1 Tax=Papilio machaon TaxID=76193 RepID=A0A194QLV5_PAPMA|nr:hypothetical protein RR48_14083 [Papilio machaon]
MKKKLLMALTIFTLSAAKRSHSEGHQHGASSGHEEHIDNMAFSQPSAGTLRRDLNVKNFESNILTENQYFQKIDTLDNRVDNLNSLVQNQTNTIIQYLMEILKLVQLAPVHVMESAIQSLKNDLDKVKYLLTHHHHSSNHSLRRGILHIFLTLACILLI